MTLKNRKFRWLAGLLALVMVMAMLPMGIVASGTSTVWGEKEVIDLVTGMNARENDFNKGWKFYRGSSDSAKNPNFNDSSWQNINLPHDFSITEHFTNTQAEGESGFLPGGTGWYRKSFTMPSEAAGKTILLNFDGAYMHTTVYVNGTEVGEHHFGYSNFAMDISRYLTCDGTTENVVAVKVVNTFPSSRWYSGSGIYRDVTLLVLDAVHVDLNGTHVTTPDIASGSGKVQVKVDVVNDGDASVNATVKNTVYAKGSNTALATAQSDVTVAAGAVATATNAPVVSSPALWSLESPNLYTVKTEVLVNGQVVDTYESEFGFRWFTFSSSGFALNGKNVKLNGVCLHHDQGAAGAAAYYDAMYRQLSIMKEMGCNAIRTSHNPADKDFIAICSELGLLVIEETFDGLVDMKNYNNNDFSGYFESAVDTRLYGASSGMTCAEYTARSMIRRDRNAACIFAWSFGNEIQEGSEWQSASRYDDICANYIRWANAEDGSRIITSGDNNRGGNQELVDVLNTIINAHGVVGFNYANSTNTLSSLASRFGGTYGCIIASETASHTNSRGQYRNQNSNTDSDGRGHLTSYDTSAVGWGITAHESIYNTYNLDNVAGEFVWTGFDYIGEPTPWNDPWDQSSDTGHNSSYFGIVETTGFPKDSYYLYRAQWNKAKPTVHLVTAWDPENMLSNSGITPVWVYTNAYKVELYLNDQLIGETIRTENKSAAGHIYYSYQPTSRSSVCSVSNGSYSTSLYSVFNVTYAAGTLSTRAYNQDGSEIVLDDSCGRHTVSTPGAAAKLSISQNRTTAAADGSSLIYVEVDVTDANGNLDTTASNNITFNITGPGEVLGVDNGDQYTVNKYQNSNVKTSSTTANINAYAGKALLIVRTTEEPGQIRINVASSGLTGGIVTVNTQEVSSGASGQGLVSYSMVKDYSVKVGTVPVLDTEATGLLADGNTIAGAIAWDSVPQNVYGTAGDYTINGILTLEGQEPIPVSARLHVIPDVIALRNVATATTSNIEPVLPSTVRGVLADGTLAGEFSVTWNSVAASEYDTVGKIVTVSGTAVIFDKETLPVTCSVRVAETINTESTNVAPMADSLTQNINGSDVLESIRNGTLKPGDNTNERWSNWGNRKNSDQATLTLTWATAQGIGSVNIYYYYDGCAAEPEAVEFSYSLNGQTYTVIGHTAEKIEEYTVNEAPGAHWRYTFDTPISPVGLKVTLTQQNGTSGNSCVAMTELEVMTYAASMEYKTSADLSGISVGGTPVSGFAADNLQYTAGTGKVTANTVENAGITVLPIHEGVVRILTVSEDGSAVKTYEVTQDVPACVVHDWNEGVITTPATPDAPGVKTFTCRVCGATKTEAVAYVGAAAPVVTLAPKTESGYLVMEAGVEEYADIVNNYRLIRHGILYIPAASLSGELTENTAGRTRVIFSGYDEDGGYTYNLLLEDESTVYAVRAFLVYTDPVSQKTVTVYSDTVSTNTGN